MMLDMLEKTDKSNDCADDDEFRAYYAASEERMRSAKKRWRITIALRWILLLLIAIVYTFAISRFAQAKALKTYEGWMEDYKLERLAKDQAAAAADPYELKLKDEAEDIARVLYGVRENDTDDMKTYCWCILNRVDNRDYPGTVSGVVNQTDQWVMYRPDNPVLESLYQIAREQVDAWHEQHRPVSPDFVFAGWSKDDIVLRDRWLAGATTKYWRYGQ